MRFALVTALLAVSVHAIPTAFNSLAAVSDASNSAETVTEKTFTGGRTAIARAMAAAQYWHEQAARGGAAKAKHDARVAAYEGRDVEDVAHDAVLAQLEARDPNASAGDAGRILVVRRKKQTA